MAKAAVAKPAFGAGVLSGLRQAAGQAQGGEPLELLLDQVEEDPDQPRSVFDDDELEQVAETIRLLGVLSPIGVRKLDGDRYALVYGARRLRASRLAGKTRIKAIIVPKEQATLVAQVIENQARTGLANSDLAGAVNRLFADKMTVKQIAVVCNLKEYQVAAFRAVEKLPPFLRSRLDQADIRALYDLFRAWEKHPAEVEDGMPAEDAYLTITEARRVIESVTGRTTSSIVLKREDERPEAPTTPPAAPQDEEEGEADGPTLPGVLDGPERPTPTPELPSGRVPTPTPTAVPTMPASPEVTPTAPAPASAAREPQPAPVFIMVTLDGEEGELMTTRRSAIEGHACIKVGTQIIETPFLELRCVSIR